MFDQFVWIVHVSAAVLAVIELGLTAFVASVLGDSPDSVNFMIFNSIWSLLVIAYIGLTPLYATHLFHKLASLALLAVTTLFWFAGSISLSARTGVPHCGANTWCGSLQAACAFGFFLFAAFAFLCGLDTIEALRGRRNAATVDSAQNTKPAVVA